MLTQKLLQRDATCAQQRSLTPHASDLKKLLTQANF